MAAEEVEEIQPVLLERGRHAITGMPDGSWVITRAGPLCERCEECGCGEQADPIPVPQFVVQVITGQSTNDGMLKRVLRMVGK